MTLHFIILAAGKGTRMNTKLPKVLHPVGHLPLIGHVVNSVNQAISLGESAATDFPSSHRIHSQRIHIVLSPESGDIQAFLESNYQDFNTVIQEEQLGTAHAVNCVLKQNPSAFHKNDTIVVLFGDTPLLSPQTILSMINALHHQDAVHSNMVVAGMEPLDPKMYGRLLLDHEGRLVKIVEYKHATEEEKAISFCNSGIMAFHAEPLLDVIDTLPRNEGTNEYYLTDAVAAFVGRGKSVTTINIPYNEAEGVNTLQDLANCEQQFQSLKRSRFLENGVVMQDPDTVYFSHDTIMENGVVLEPHVYCGPGVHIQKGACINAFSHLEGAMIHENATVGPFARLRPGTCLEANSRVGNFVEVKNTVVGQHSKVNHLSYVGDANIGPRSNIGAGTITCNYDGFSKHKTVIEENVFIGSNTCLVAPVTVQKGAMTAAGSTVTKLIPADDLCVARAPQKNLAGKAKSFREQKKRTTN